MNNDQQPVNTPQPSDVQGDSTGSGKDITNNISFFSTKAFKFLSIIVVILILLLVSAFYFLTTVQDADDQIDGQDKPPTVVNDEDFEMEQFASAEEFEEYLQESAGSAFFGVDLLNVTIPDTTAEIDLGPQGQFSNLRTEDSVSRVSQTNVQVAGIDEPDILKTDGTNIYFSDSNSPIIQPFIGLEREIAPSEDLPVDQPDTKIVQVFPPENIQSRSDIDETGEMLLTGNDLVLFTNNEILGYDVSDKSNPVRKWNLELENDNNNRTTVVTSRLYLNSIFVVTSSYVRSSSPCPIPLTTGASSLIVPCTDIFRPSVPVNTDSTFTVMRIDPSDGSIDDSISFVGSSNGSVVYMSENSLYVTNTTRMDETEIFADFFISEGDEFFPDDVISRIEEISEYDISDESKFMEYQIAVEKYQSTLSDDERKQMQNELQNRMEEYFASRSRELLTTGINKISLGGLSIESTGSVPGRPLNQFSLDEYENNLRIATTSDGSFVSDSVNDVYVLNSELEQIGSVLDLGLTERIYAVRFLGDKGYVVTFRRIDPFYVLDLSNPQAPEMKGELKIPGFSSYLHPLSDNRVLGVGEENSKVKVSLFDVSDPNNPVESDKYDLDEYDSEVLRNHRAFLIDEQHEIFFMPAGGSGYIFDYSSGLNLQKVVADIQAQRALYINDYLYIVGNEIVVLDENSWEEVSRVEL